MILEYIDMMSMAAITAAARLELGSAPLSRMPALATSSSSSREIGAARRDVEALGDVITALGALEVYVLPPRAATELIEARERAFFAAKARQAPTRSSTRSSRVPRSPSFWHRWQ